MKRALLKFFWASGILLCAGPAAAQSIRAPAGVCEENLPSPGSGPIATITVSPTSLVKKSLVHAFAIYVTFSDQPAHELPAVHAVLERELPAFIWSMSDGRHELHVETALRPAPRQNLCYVADSAFSFYQPKIHRKNPVSAEYERLTEEILTKVFADHPDFPDRFDVVLLNIIGDFQLGTDGFSWLALGKIWSQRFKGVGATIDLVDDDVFLGLAGHEYGHLLGASHPPFHLQKSFGNYELMDQYIHRLAPYSVQTLLDIGWLASERVVAVDDTLLNLRLADVRRGGKVLLVEMDANQYFLIANHQGTDYDSVYKGRGLLIWHMAGNTKLRSARTLWDLESAAGLFSASEPDPVTGSDSLDLSRTFAGSAADFFHPGGAARLGPDTNPNTNFYDQPNQFPASQSVSSNITVANLRHSPASTDIIFDVFFPADQPPCFVETREPGPILQSYQPAFVRTIVKDDRLGLEVELLYRQSIRQNFKPIKMQDRGSNLFLAMIEELPPVAQIQYFLRATDSKGQMATYPANAPDSLLSFYTAPSFEKLVTINDHEPALPPGDSVALPVIFNNHGDLALGLEGQFIYHESFANARASDSNRAVPEVYVPENWSAPDFWENHEQFRAASANLYYRGQDFSQPVITLHLAHDDSSFLMLMETIFAIGVSFEIDFIWRDNNYTQEVQMRITGAHITTTSNPAIPVKIPWVIDSRGLLDRSLRFGAVVPWPTFASFGRHQRLEFRSSVRLTPTQAKEPIGQWPGLNVPEQFGTLVLGESSPAFRLDATDWRMNPGEQKIRHLLISAPSEPWLSELHGALAIRITSPFEMVHFIPLKAIIASKSSPNETDSEPAQPLRFSLLPSHPNPARLHERAGAEIRIGFALPEPARIRLEVFDVLGRKIADLSSAEYDKGIHTVRWNGDDSTGRRVGSGIYFIRLSAGRQLALRKMIVL